MAEESPNISVVGTLMYLQTERVACHHLTRNLHSLMDDICDMQYGLTVIINLKVHCILTLPGFIPTSSLLQGLFKPILIVYDFDYVSASKSQPISAG